MGRRGFRHGFVTVGAFAALAAVAAFGTGVPAFGAPGDPIVVVGCLGVDRGSTGSQIRVGFVTSGPDGLYRAAFAGPGGPVQGEGRVAGGRGLVIVRATGPGAYDDLVLTNVDTGQAVDRGPLGVALPLRVGGEAVGCDPAALVVPAGDTTPATTPGAATPDDTTPASTDSTDRPASGVSTAAPDRTPSASSSATPPWLLLAIPGVVLAAGGVVLLIKGRSASRSRPAT